MQKLQAELKLLNVRTEKWREMLRQTPFKDINLVRKRIRKGVPPGMRQIVWPRLLEIQRFRYDSHENYDLLIRQRSCIEGEIRLDIPRTYTEEKAQEMRTSLFNVLKALSLVYPELGYCQGMNHLSMKLLETVTDESGFWIMNYLIRTERNIMWNYKNPSSTQLQNWVLQELMAKHAPNFLKALKKHSIQLLAFTPKWFITLFSSTLPTQLFYRIFECFLVDGYKIIYKAALILLKLNEPFVVQNQYEEILKHLLGKKQYQNIDIEGFCEALHKLQVSEEDIELLELRFINENFQKVIKWQEESQEHYQRRLQEQRGVPVTIPNPEQETGVKYPKLDLVQFQKIPFDLYQFD